MNGKQMCEFIVAELKPVKKDKTPMTPEDVWNISASGELYMVFALYDAAKRAKAAREKLANIAKK